MNFDETRCSDTECDTEGGAKVGEYLIVDRNTGHDKGQWADAYRLADGRLVCEDCASAACEGHPAIDSGPGYENEAIGTTVYCDGSCRPDERETP